MDAGATTINIPDTVGLFAGRVWGFDQGIKNVIDVSANDAVIRTHCQNDLGLSTANSLAGIANGARQVECTIGGIGERAGNASLEEIAMSVIMRGQNQLNGAFMGINPVYIYQTSRMVSRILRYARPTAQSHRRRERVCARIGIHQDGMLKNKLTYEIIAPMIGVFETEGKLTAWLWVSTRETRIEIKLGQLGVTLTNG